MIERSKIEDIRGIGAQGKSEPDRDFESSWFEFYDRAGLEKVFIILLPVIASFAIEWSNDESRAKYATHKPDKPTQQEIEDARNKLTSLADKLN